MDVIWGMTNQIGLHKKLLHVYLIYTAKHVPVYHTSFFVWYTKSEPDHFTFLCKLIRKGHMLSAEASGVNMLVSFVR